MRFNRFGLTLLLLLCLGGSADAQEIVEWRPLHGGPYASGMFHIYALDSTGRLWGGHAEQPLYWSDDDGAYWQEGSVHRMVDLAVRPDGVLVAADDSGRVWSSHDNGERWTHDLGTIPLQRPYPRRITAARDGSLYIVAREDVDRDERTLMLFRRREGETTWSSMGQVGQTGRGGADVDMKEFGDRLLLWYDGQYGLIEEGTTEVELGEINPVVGEIGFPVMDEGGRMYASNGEAIFTANDTGRSGRWIFYADLPDGGTLNLQYQPPATFYAERGWNSYTPSSLLISTDAAETWTTTSIDPFHKGVGRALFTTGGTCLLELGSGVGRTTDRGSSWDLVNEGVRSIWAAPFHATRRSLVVGGGEYVNTTTDAGSSWHQWRDSIPSQQVPIGWEYCSGFVDIVEDSEGRLYGACPLGVYRSDDGGITWAVSGLQGKELHALSLAGDSLYAFAKNYLWYWRSTDQGETWDTVETAEDIWGIEYDSRSGSYYGRSGDTWYESIDRGETWPRFLLHARFLKVDTSTGHLYAASLNQSSEPWTFRYSTDRGASWTAVDRHPDDPMVIRDMVIEPGGDCYLIDLVGNLYRWRAEPFEWTRLANEGERFETSWLGFDNDGRAIVSTKYRGLWKSARPLTATVAPDRVSASVVVAPNPARDAVVIRLSASAGEISGVRIVDLSGAVLHEGSVAIDLSSVELHDMRLSLDPTWPDPCFLQLRIDGRWSAATMLRSAE